MDDHGAERSRTALEEAADLTDRALWALRLVESAAALPVLEVELEDADSSRNEREVLRVLAEARGHSLAPAGVREQMSSPPTRQRVGQILRRLHARGVVLASPRRARGGEAVPHYSLSEQGESLCSRLGLGPDAWADKPPSPFFAKWHTLPLARRDSDRASTIFSFHSVDADVGRTTALALVACRTADYFRHTGRRLLVLDLDIETPSLDPLLTSSQALPRGFAQIFLDYFRCPVESRREWLRNSLLPPADYVVQPHPETLPDFLYMPSGLGARDGAATAAYTRVRTMMEDAVRCLQRGGRDAPAIAFIEDFRRTLNEEIDCVIADTHAGLGWSAYVATVLLADVLVSWIHPSTREASNHERVLEHFLAQQPERLPPQAIVPVLAPVRTSVPSLNIPLDPSWLARLGLEGSGVEEGCAPVFFYEDPAVRSWASLLSASRGSAPSAAERPSTPPLGVLARGVDELARVLDGAIHAAAPFPTSCERLVAKCHELSGLGDVRERQREIAGMVPELDDEQFGVAMGYLTHVPRLHQIDTRRVLEDIARNLPSAPSEDVTCDRESIIAGHLEDLGGHPRPLSGASAH